jgi:hypothetical protein
MGLFMSLDFQQVRQQVAEMGKTAPRRVEHLQRLYKKALETLISNADQVLQLRGKVSTAVGFNPILRCAVPGSETLNHTNALPPMPEKATIIAADGSQINPDRHASVDYCLINIGAIQMRLGEPDAPSTTVQSDLLYDDQLYTETGRLSERLVALRRDLRERQFLAKLAKDAPPPLITLADGPLELWIGQEKGQDAKEYKKAVSSYQEVLHDLHQSGASTVGYIDKPRGDLLVRLLEIALLPMEEIANAGKRAQRKLLGVTDTDLFQNILAPGERSAIFGIQSQNAKIFADEIRTHFFYLNVGSGKGPKAYPVRVEIPTWVVESDQMVDGIHAVLVDQCKILGTRTYPYLLHRAHEVAVVTRDDKKQVERMIALELYKRGLNVGEKSHKQGAKDLAGRTRI